MKGRADSTEAVEKAHFFEKMCSQTSMVDVAKLT